MEDIFSNPIGIPSHLMCKIIGSLPAEDISKVPYVSYNWYLTCKKSSFIKEHSSCSRLNNFRHILFCVLDLDGGALPFFLQLHPLVDNERAVVTFSRIPSFLAQAAKNGEFCILVIWDSVDGDARTFMSVFCSFTRTWCDAPQPVYGAKGIFKESIHIDGYIYWLSAEKDTALGIATWTNVTEYHKTYNIWLTQHSEDGEIGWFRHRRIDNSPTLLRFLDFTGDYLIVITEKMQFYDDEEHNISQGLIFLESQDVGIIRLMTSPYTDPFAVKKMFSFFQLLG
ncbi:uncharacterized protein G2W53_010525 [Senna tora]|uniref:F-box domain-containing protein n=1 Tax=Senna tora TaxID=362788 RepID=A0A835CBH2_9FABA|nr:uncharacterized protein G2W53_010525 [Senna tora]